MNVHSKTLKLSVPPLKLKRYRLHAAKIARRAEAGKYIHLHDLQSIVGKFQSCAQCVDLTRLHLNHLFLALRRADEKGGSVKLSPLAINE
jgi:hypothetical protein